MSIGDERLAHLRKELENLREQTEDGAATKIGITDNRYQRSLNNVEKVLIDYAEEIKGDPETWPPIVLLALDVLGVDTDDLGWAPHAERADRMGW